MKKSLLVLGIALVMVSASAMATEQTPHKTVLKKTDHTAACSTPSGKLKKECTHTSSTRPAGRQGY